MPILLAMCTSAFFSRQSITIFIIILVSFTGAPVLASRDLPVEGRITSGIGWRIDPFGSGRMVYHHGVDISVPVGTPVHPIQKGYVLFAGQLRNYGFTVAVAHGDGYLSFYGHNSEVCVKPGQWVNTDAVIARSGNTGRSTGPHVHYEVRRLTGRARELQEEYIRAVMEQIAAGADAGDSHEEEG